MSKSERNPARYRELNVPRPAEELTASIDAFIDDVWAARLKHRIPDALIVVRAVREAPDGGIEQELITLSHCGHELNMGSMANYAAGVAEERLRQDFARARAAGKR